MAKGYLLDNNHVAAWYNKMPQVMQKVRSLPPETLICTCAIILGEVEAGHEMTKTSQQTIRDDYKKWVDTKFLAHCIDVRSNVRNSYAKILGKLWEKYPPPQGKKTERHLAEVHGVDINDVWSAAVAYSHGLVFVTNDRMKKIREALPELQFEDWM